MAEHEYWVVGCKTTTCKQEIFLKCLGPHMAGTVHFRMANRAGEPFQVSCPACEKSYQYSQAELRTIIGPEPPSDFVTHPSFLKREGPSVT